MECSGTVPTCLNTCSVLPFFIYVNLLFHCDFSHRGILAIAWSMADSELLLSCGKDAKILCSNPNTGEVLYSDNFHHLRTGRKWGWIFVCSPWNYAAVGCFSVFTCG